MRLPTLGTGSSKAEPMCRRTDSDLPPKAGLVPEPERAGLTVEEAVEDDLALAGALTAASMPMSSMAPTAVVKGLAAWEATSSVGKTLGATSEAGLEAESADQRLTVPDPGVAEPLAVVSMPLATAVSASLAVGDAFAAAAEETQASMLTLASAAGGAGPTQLEEAFESTVLTAEETSESTPAADVGLASAGALTQLLAAAGGAEAIASVTLAAVSSTSWALVVAATLKPEESDVHLISAVDTATPRGSASHVDMALSDALRVPTASALLSAWGNFEAPVGSILVAEGFMLVKLLADVNVAVAFTGPASSSLALTPAFTLDDFVAAMRELALGARATGMVARRDTATIRQQERGVLC